MIGWIFPTVAFFLLALAGWIEAARQTRKRNQARAQRNKLNTKNAELFAQNADLHEALRETVAERESLRLQLDEALKTKPLPVRKPRKKNTETQP